MSERHMHRYATGAAVLIASVIAADCPAWGLGCGDRRELATEVSELAAKVSVDNAKTQRLAMEVDQSPNADHSADKAQLGAYTVEVCGYMKDLADTDQKLITIIENDANHCGVDDGKLRKLKESQAKTMNSASCLAGRQ
jgi:hypothetical protein